MSEIEAPNPDGQPNIEQLSHTRILVLMGLIVIFGALASSFYVSGLFGLGFLLGGILSFVNYYWLKASLRKVFAEADGEHRPRVSAARYIFRYITIGGIIGFVFLTHTVPIVSVILGLTAFALAVVVEAVIRLFSIAFSSKVI